MKASATAVFLLTSLLSLFSADTTPPNVLSVNPPPGSTVNGLTRVTVTFSEPIMGISWDDLLANSALGVSISGSGAVWTFNYDPAPTLGNVVFTWDPGNNITDLASNRFDSVSSTWSYMHVDTTAPTVVQMVPINGMLLSSFGQTEVQFSELVRGADAGYLLANGVPATNIIVWSGNRFLFQFPPITNGPVVLTWTPGQQIKDLAGNAFQGSSWGYNVDSTSGVGLLRINEFLAANVSTNGLKDEDGELANWIEIYNQGSNVVNMAGYSLTDDANDPGRWVFPSTNVGPGQFLIVLATEKNRTPTNGRPLHANFQLNAFGGYIGLYGPGSPRPVLGEFSPQYPTQRNTYSYGYDTNNALKYFIAPTPGARNGGSAISGITAPPHFNVVRGFFDAPFNLILSSPTPGAQIRYTKDGSDPTLVNSLAYTNTLRITNTTLFRAAAFLTNMLPSSTVTHTYLFLDQVIRQPNNPTGFPTGATVMGGYPADYEMDPEIVTNAAYKDIIKPALKAIPSVSIVLKPDDMFGATSGIYTHSSDSTTLYRGPDWQKACSAEYILTNGQTGFAVDCGISIQGNASRNPQKTPKHPFRLLFKGSFGPSKLDYPVFADAPVSSFDSLVMRADYNNAWWHWDPTQRSRGTRIRDAWTKDTSRAMGNAAGHSSFLHLYLNGVYWGLYEFSEKTDSAFAANYFGGNKEDYDAIGSKPTQAVDGDLIAYNGMTTFILTNDMSIYSNYAQACKLLDMNTFIDYMLLNFYGGNEDWGFDGNWNAIRKRAPGETFKYITWDGEMLLNATNVNRVNNADVPSGLHTNLVNSAEYRLAFADRAYKHLYNGGALSPSANSLRWQKWASYVNLPIVAESARWGDYRRDVAPYSTAPYDLYARDTHWVPEVNRLINNYFPQRSDIVLGQLRSVVPALYPDPAVVFQPMFNQHGGRVARGFRLQVINGPYGTVYYTTNGTDPRVMGTGAVSPDARALAYAGTIPINNNVQIKARALSGGNWSTLADANFIVDSIGTPLRITEIMYNPTSGDAYEFLELKNTGGTILDVGGYSIGGEVFYIFPPGTLLTPGQVIVLASDKIPGNWTNRYPGITPSGWFHGKLSNSGGAISIVNAQNQVLFTLNFDNNNGWPSAADGLGYSLEIIDPLGNPSDPANWRASDAPNGTPGAFTTPTISPVLLNEVMAFNVTVVSNADTHPDWVELYNSGTAPTDVSGWSLSNDSNPLKYIFPSPTQIDAGGYLVVWCDDATNTTPGLHAGFALSHRGENLFLYNAAGIRADAVSFGTQLPDYSIGRIGGAWQLSIPTPNATNQAATMASTTNLVINEWMAYASAQSPDWIELYNRSTNQPVSLNGIYLGTSNTLDQLGWLSFVPPGGYIQLFADQQSGPDHLNFKLPKESGLIAFYDLTGKELDRVTYGLQIEGISQGRLPDGKAKIVSFAGTASPGSTNYQSVSIGVILNEVMALNVTGVTNPLGRTPDWVELWNSNAIPVDLSGMSLSDNPAHPGQWYFPLGVSMPGNSCLVVWFDKDQPPSLTSGSVLNTGHGIGRQSGGVYFFNNLGQRVDAVEYGFQVPNMSIGRVAGQWSLVASPTPGVVNASTAPLGSPIGLRINEWMANAGPQKDDWFELYNTNSLPVELSGLSLSDSASVDGYVQYVVPPLSYIAGNGFATWIADANTQNGFNHVDFSLDDQGEVIRVYSTNYGIIDTLYYDVQQAGVSQGRLSDGGANIISFSTTATPSESNYLPLNGPVINEVLSHNPSPLEAAIEVRNTSRTSADLSGWYLSDSQQNFRKYRIPNGTVLDSSGFLVFYEYEFNGGVGSLVPFTIDPVHGGEIWLSQADANGNLTGLRDKVTLGSSTNGLSYGRYETSVGFDFVPQRSTTLGMDNPPAVDQFRQGLGTNNAQPLLGPVVINEVMYHPPDLADGSDNSADEFIELYNRTTNAVALYDLNFPANVWRIRGGASYDFPSALILGAHQFLLVVNFNPSDISALAAFRNKYGIAIDVPIFGPYQNKLANSEDTVELQVPLAPVIGGPDDGFVPHLTVDSVHYLDGAPWPASADGMGNSLQRHRPWDYGNDPVNWKGALPTPGRPNVSGTSYVDMDNDGMDDNWELTHGLNPANPNDANLDKDGDGMSNYEEFLAETLPDDASSFVAPPQITRQPRVHTAFLNGDALFSVAADGTFPMNYQWYFNETPISNATNSTFVVSNFQSGNVGYYWVKLANDQGFVTSEQTPILNIITPPSNLTITNGVNATFGISVTGTGIIGYQWKFNNANIPNATNLSLTLTNAVFTNLGIYSVTVTDDIGELTSPPALLTVLLKPVIQRQPLSQIALAGSDVNLDVLATGNQPMGYFWRRGTLKLLATNIGFSTFVLTNVQTATAGVYQVVITNLAAPAYLPSVATASSNTYISVVTSWPSNQTASSGTNITFQVAVTAPSGAVPHSYKWIFNGGIVAGQTNTQLTLTNVQSANQGIYSVVISNAYAMFTTPPAFFLLKSIPTELRAPQLVNGRFQINVSGLENTSYGLETSSNLVDWIQADTWTYTNGVMTFSTAVNANAPLLFYRLRTPPKN